MIGRVLRDLGGEGGGQANHGHPLDVIRRGECGRVAQELAHHLPQKLWTFLELAAAEKERQRKRPEPQQAEEHHKVVQAQKLRISHKAKASWAPTSFSRRARSSTLLDRSVARRVVPPMEETRDTCKRESR